MVDLVKIQKRTNKDAIELLEEAIAEIKAGDITEVCIAFVTSDGGIGFESSEGKRAILLGAAISMAERNFHKDNIDL